jgi:hypothetical protein
MIAKIRARTELLPFFTDELLENGYGVIIEEDMPEDSYLAIDIDEYYHRNVKPTPEIADILLVAQQLSVKDRHHIFIVEMKNIDSPKYFKVKNIQGKFNTAIEDFMKTRYADIFLDNDINVVKFRLLFITDAYKLKRRGFSDAEIHSFLLDTKIAVLQSIPLFSYRGFNVGIEYEMPNPVLSWK